MQLYLSRWTFDSDRETYTPLSGPGWVGGLLDLRGTGLGDGWCLLEYPTVLVNPPNGVIRIAESWEYLPSTPESNRIEDELGWPRASMRGLTVREMAILWRGESIPTKQGRSIIWVGSTKIRDEQTHDPQAASIMYTETWPQDGLLSATTQDRVWSSITGDLAGHRVLNSKLRKAKTNTQIIVMASPCDTDNNYVQAMTQFFIDAAFDNYWVGCRHAASVRTGYYLEYFIDGWSNEINGQVVKFVNGTRTTITSMFWLSLWDGDSFNVYIEADGDSIYAVADGSQDFQVTDGSITTGKYGAIGFQGEGTTQLVDTVVISDIGGVPFTPHSRVIGDTDFSGDLL